MFISNSMAIHQTVVFCIPASGGQNVNQQNRPAELKFPHEFVNESTQGAVGHSVQNNQLQDRKRALFSWCLV